MLFLVIVNIVGKEGFGFGYWGELEILLVFDFMRVW